MLLVQVHRAWLSDAGAAATGMRPGELVAVKVRHPGVTHVMHRDFVLMQRAAAAAGLLPGVADLRLDESIRQFGGPLKEQLDLSIEVGPCTYQAHDPASSHSQPVTLTCSLAQRAWQKANLTDSPLHACASVITLPPHPSSPFIAQARHLQRFNHNFRAWASVRFPTPLFPLVAPDVLVETYEEGNLISTYVADPEPGSRKSGFLAETGLNLYLQVWLDPGMCEIPLKALLCTELDEWSCGFQVWASRSHG